MYQERQISLRLGYKTRRLGITVTSFWELKLCEKQISLTLYYFLINSALLYHFLANLLGKNQKMSEKSNFCKASSPEMTSQSFPVSWFCTIWRFWYIKTPAKKNAIKIFVFAILISTLWKFYRANKKNLSYTLKIILIKLPSTCPWP